MIGNVDRISEGYIIIRMEDNSIRSFLYEKYPFIKTGDIVIINDNIITVDEEATKKMKDRIIKLQRKVFK